MQKIVIISTGGTFNKIYNPKNGELFIDKTSSALTQIAYRWLSSFEIINIIGKDSLDIVEADRKQLVETIRQNLNHKIIIIHGTDTMNLTAEYLDKAKLGKQIILTGAMIPYHINPIEATANLASALGYSSGLGEKEGIFITMNGVCGAYQKVKKERSRGVFTHA